MRSPLKRFQRYQPLETARQFYDLEVGLMDLWGCFVQMAYMYMRGGIHLSGKSAADFADELSAAVDIGMGSIKTFLWQILLKLEEQGVT